MFNELFVFEKQRSGIQAVGFYLFYLLVVIVVGALLGLLGSIFAGTDFAGGVMLGQIGAVLVCLALSFLVLFKKNKLRNAGLLVIALLSGVGAYLLGGFLGLAATAYLTTLEPER